MDNFRSRRTFFKEFGTVLGGLILAPRSAWFSPSLGPHGSAGLASASAVPLKKLAADKGLLFGCAVNRRNISDKDYAELVAEQCSIIVPALELKWNVVHPRPNSFNFEPGDALLQFARSHGLLFRGHTLVWHNALPDWFFGYVNRGNAKQMLLQHIATVMGHYRGKMHSWDVVNEATLPNGLRDSPWLQLLGPDYIDMAFRAARDADPDTLLVYNDFDLDYDNDDGKRSQVLQLLHRLVSAGAPVQALGIQGHIKLNQRGRRFNPKKLRKFMDQVSDLGLKMLITELDVRESDEGSTPNERDRIVASAYEEYLSTVLDNKNVIAVLTWGLAD